MMASILAIDDEPEILAFVKKALEREGHFVQTAKTTGEVSSEMLKFADLILLDVMMPEEDGFSYLEHIRNIVDSPILFITAKTAENDLIHGFGLGADDYIEKPFTIGHLRARVGAHLRRESRVHLNTIHIGDFILDLSGKEVRYKNSTISLTKSEYAICTILLEHAGQVFSKSQLYEMAFGYEGESDESTIVEHIKNIRAKLKNYGIEPIETVWGIGYRWKREKESV